MPNAEDEYSYDKFNSGFNESDLNDQDQSIEEFADEEDSDVATSIHTMQK